MFGHHYNSRQEAPPHQWREKDVTNIVQHQGRPRRGLQSGMVRWCVDRGELQGTMSDVDYVVPRTAGDKNTVALAELDLCVQAVLIVAHANKCNTGFHAN